MSPNVLYLVAARGSGLELNGMRAGEGAAIFFLVLSSFAASVVAPTKSELESLYAAAAQDVKGGHYRDALKKLDALDARQPDVAAALNLRGVAWMRLTEYRLAETALRKAREIDPDFWEARFNLAEVAFLTGDWTEARRRFTALLAEPNEHLEGATNDLIQFKILLSFLLEDKEKLGAPVLEKLKASVETPAAFYAKAALALQQKNRPEAKAWMEKAAKEFSPQLNKLFAESFYEVGWLPKPEGATPVALEITSAAERVADAQANLARAERAYHQRDLEGAWQLLDRVDATAPNQAVTYNLRGEILLEKGKIDEAETALQKALAADPQLLSARYNLAQVAFARRNYETARKEWEAILGAFSGRKEERKEQLIRYQIYLTLLLESHEGAAQKAMDDFKMMDGSPALYYAQAAWAFQHGNPKQAKNWVSNASNLYSAELNREFAAPFADLGWVNNGTTAAAATPAPPVLLPSVSAKPAATPSATAAAVKVVEETSPSPTEVKTRITQSAASPSPSAEVSATSEKVARVEKKRNKDSTASAKPRKKRAARKKSSRENASVSRSSRPAADQQAVPAAAASPSIAPPVSTPFSTPAGAPVRENLGDKVKNFFLYPFKRPLLTPTPAPTSPPANPSANVAGSPTPAAIERRPNN
jgi:tetratricopeptide (TPR) repeat protein